MSDELTLERIERLLATLPKIRYNRAMVGNALWNRLRALPPPEEKLAAFIGLPVYLDGRLAPNEWQLWLDDELIETGEHHA